jgi:hypothetical protein
LIGSFQSHFFLKMYHNPSLYHTITYLLFIFKKFPVSDATLTFNACEALVYMWSWIWIKKVPHRTSPKASGHVRTSKQHVSI